MLVRRLRAELAIPIQVISAAVSTTSNTGIQYLWSSEWPLPEVTGVCNVGVSPSAAAPLISLMHREELTWSASRFLSGRKAGSVMDGAIR